jgi:hypothetical protein
LYIDTAVSYIIDYLYIWYNNKLYYWLFVHWYNSKLYYWLFVHWYNSKLYYWLFVHLIQQ